MLKAKILPQLRNFTQTALATIMTFSMFASLILLHKSNTPHIMVKLAFKQELFSGESDLNKSFNSEQSCQDGRRTTPFNDIDIRYWKQWVNQNEEGEEDEEEMDSQLYSRFLENYNAKSGVKALKKNELLSLILKEPLMKQNMMKNGIH